MASSDQDLVKHSLHSHLANLDDRNFQIHGRTLFFGVLVFSIITAIALVVLFARWLYRLNCLLPVSTSQSPHLLPPPQQSQGLDPTALSKIPITLHRCLPGAEEMECCICLGILQDGEKVKILPKCGHCYHSECVDTWLVTQSSCPLCRTPLPTVIVAIE